jgi:tRNA acetyltransferase TAN1
MSVVGGDYDRLKRFNLAEIYDPTPKTGEAKATETPKTTEAKA